MSKFVFSGEESQINRILTVSRFQKYLDHQMIGQITEIPGKGLYMRKTEPRLNQMTVEESIHAADRVISYQQYDGEALQLCIAHDKPFVYVNSLTKDSHFPWARILYERYGYYKFGYLNLTVYPKEKKLPEFHIVYNEDSFYHVLNTVISVTNRNYRVNLCSIHAELNAVFQMFCTYDEDADANIYFDPDTEAEMYPKDLDKQLLTFLLQTVPAQIFANHMMEAYEKWKCDMHELDTEAAYQALYFSGTRKTILLNKTEGRIWNALKTGDMNTLLNIPRNDLEIFSKMGCEEHAACSYYKMLLSTGHAKIENAHDVILSFIGSKRCNMRCNYCFSDHTCEKLSCMSPAETLKVADMVTEGRQEGLNLHVDNNLGGEPIADWEAVKQRHNIMVNFHKQTGIKASFGLLTNGTLLEKKHLAWLKENLIYIGFSLDGDQITHDAIRHDAALQPTYEKTIKAIGLLKEYPWPVEAGISCVITKNNLEIKNLQEHFRETLDVHHVVMKPVRAASDEDYALTYEDIPRIKQAYTEFFDYLLDKGKSGDLDPFFTMLQPLDYAARFMLRTFYSDRIIVKRCGAGEVIFSADDKGHVYPCDSFNGIAGKEIGDLSNGMYREREFEIPFVTKKEPTYGCPSCWARFLCGGICEYVTYINNYDYNDVIRMECELSKFLAESALVFWVKARRTWKPETMEQVRRYIKEIGVEPLEDASFVYAPC